VPAHKKDVSDDALMINTTQQTLGFVGTDYLELMNIAVFGKHAPCFNSASEALFKLFLHAMFQVEVCSLSPSDASAFPWFYPGSCGLILKLSCAEKECILGINPDWVYQNLPLNPANKSTLSSLDDALAEQSLSLEVHLDAVHLPLKQLLSIQVGDVITSDHPLSQPLVLCQQEKIIAHAELGQVKQHKSIVLKRLS
jgi:flagellar motor switch/type III secretory pathway protein FliN